MRAAHATTAILKTVMPVLLALVMAIRVVAQPALLAAPDPGLMVICAGGQIVYVSMETGLPVDADSETELLSDPCPFFGVTAFDLHADKPLPTPLKVPAALSVVPVHAAQAAPGAPNQNAARAPPLRI